MTQNCLKPKDNGQSMQKVPQGVTICMSTQLGRCGMPHTYPLGRPHASDAVKSSRARMNHAPDASLMRHRMITLLRLSRQSSQSARTALSGQNVHACPAHRATEPQLN